MSRECRIQKIIDFPYSSSIYQDKEVDRQDSVAHIPQQTMSLICMTNLFLTNISRQTTNFTTFPDKARYAAILSSDEGAQDINNGGTPKDTSMKMSTI